MLVISGAQLLGTKKERGWGGSQNVDYIMNGFKKNGVDEIHYVEMRYPGMLNFNAIGLKQTYSEREWGHLYTPQQGFAGLGEDQVKQQVDWFLEVVEFLLLGAEYDFIFLLEHNLIERYFPVIKKNAPDTPVFYYELDALPNSVIENKKEFFKQMDGIICVEGAFQVLLKQVDIENTITINNGVDTSVFYPIDNLDKTILANFIGNYAKQREEQLEYLFFEPSNLFPDETFLLRGTEKDHTPDYKLAAYPNIIRDGYAMHPEICRIHNSSHLAVSSHFGMWLDYPGVTGQKVFEIMASGTPPLSHDSIGMQSVIEDYKTGFLANNIDDVIERYQYCLDNPNEAKKIGMAAHKKAVENFTWDKRVEDMMKYIKGTNK